MASDDELPEIPVVCPECDTRTKVAFDEVERAVQRHNDHSTTARPSPRSTPRCSRR
nr:hypothetical protein [Halomicroarcula sp. SYNS111]